MRLLGHMDGIHRAQTPLRTLSYLLTGILFTINPRIIPLGAYLFFQFLHGGLFERGVYSRGA